ncbi:MAG: TIGR01212 family radical SAM protein [Crocinitomicaceae bacterium]
MEKYPWEGKRPWNDYSSYVRRTFGDRVQKLSIDAGFTCPNRDGSKGIKGCTYCNNNSFNPDYCRPIKSITQQLEEGMEFFERRSPQGRYLAYFQAYTNTYDSLSNLKRMYEEALSVDGIEGLVIGTRPDCIDEEKLDYIESIAKEKYVSLEFGIESMNNDTLMSINRCQTVEDTIRAFEMASNRGIHLGGHIILGLPGENLDIYIEHAAKISQLPLDSFKMHHLQVVKGSLMYKQYQDDPTYFDLFTPETYIDTVIQFVEHLRPDIVIERFIAEAPANILVAPKWGMKNFEFIDKLEKEMIKRNTHQGAKVLVKS